VREKGILSNASPDWSLKEKRGGKTWPSSPSRIVFTTVIRILKKKKESRRRRLRLGVGIGWNYGKEGRG